MKAVMIDQSEDDAGARDRSGIQSVEVAGAVLHAIIDAQRPVGLAEIARLAAMHPSKVHRYLVSLARIGLVEQDLQNGRYGAGALTVPLALVRLRTLDVVSCAAPVLQDLRDETGETALLAIWSERGPVVLKLEESARPVFLNIRVGSTLPLYESATGLIYAAHLPAAQLARIAAAPRHWTERRADAIRRARLASVSGALVPGVNAMAAPVFDAFGAIVAAIGLLGRDDDLDVSENSSHATALRGAADRLSAQLGFTDRREAD